MTPRSPSTLGSFLRAFTFGHVRQLDAVASRVLAGLAETTPGPLILVNEFVGFMAAHQQGGWAMELQGMFLFAALAILLLGPGRYAINQR